MVLRFETCIIRFIWGLTSSSQKTDPPLRFSFRTKMPTGSHFVRSHGAYFSLCSVVTDGGRGNDAGRWRQAWKGADMLEEGRHERERCISSLPNEVLMLGGGVTKTRASGGKVFILILSIKTLLVTCSLHLHSLLCEVLPAHTYCFQHILLNWRSNSRDASAAQWSKATGHFLSCKKWELIYIGTWTSVESLIDGLWNRYVRL